MKFTEGEVIAKIQNWLEKSVIGLNLCPFAKTVYAKNQIRYFVSSAQTTTELLSDLKREMESLRDADPDNIETTLVIHPHVLNDFLDYNDFLHVADGALEELDLVGELQIASFHPQYQFVDTAPDDISNFTNRSPFPILHLLREASIENAIATFPDTKNVPERNIETMRKLGLSGWEKLKI